MRLKMSSKSRRKSNRSSKNLSVLKKFGIFFLLRSKCAASPDAVDNPVQWQRPAEKSFRPGRAGASKLLALHFDFPSGRCLRSKDRRPAQGRTPFPLNFHAFGVELQARPFFPFAACVLLRLLCKPTGRLKSVTGVTVRRDLRHNFPGVGFTLYPPIKCASVASKGVIVKRCAIRAFFLRSWSALWAKEREIKLREGGTLSRVFCKVCGSA